MTETQPRTERISVVRTLEDFLRVVAVRSIVYVEGQSCPFDEEFDGNDFCGVHLVGWVNDEPAASLRLRFFASFAKVERLAVRKDFRTTSIAARIVRTGLTMISRKGYRTAYGHARLEIEHFWCRFGARRRPMSKVFSFSGQNYVEMVLDLPPINDVIEIDKDPLIINRPEGDWDRAGILEIDRPSRHACSANHPA